MIPSSSVGVLGNQSSAEMGTHNLQQTTSLPGLEAMARNGAVTELDYSMCQPQPDVVPSTAQNLDWGLLRSNASIDSLVVSPGQFQEPTTTSMNSEHSHANMSVFDIESLIPQHNYVSKSSSNFGTLGTRLAINPASFFMTKIILGQIESYPRMMFESLALPPFIHSRCALDDTLSHNCSSKEYHECLPPALSICAALVRLYYTKTPANSAFVWNTIYAEQDRLYCEVH